MTQKNEMDVLIDGKIYKLSGAEEEMYLQRVAAYLNGKIGKLREGEGFSRLSTDYQAVLLQLNIADDYFKEEERAKKLEEKNSDLEKQIYSLKHDLVRMQMELEAARNESGGGQEEQKKADKEKNASETGKSGTERKRGGSGSRSIPKL